MGITDFLKQHEVTTYIVENHPLVFFGLDQETREVYLMALGLLSNANDDIHKNKIEFLKLLARTFELEESFVDACLAFAKNPDSHGMKIIEGMLKKDHDMQMSFIIDAYFLSYVDDHEIDDKENEVLKALFKLVGCEPKAIKVGEIFGKSVFCNDAREVEAFLKQNAENQAMVHDIANEDLPGWAKGVGVFTLFLDRVCTALDDTASVFDDFFKNDSSRLIFFKYAIDLKDKLKKYFVFELANEVSKDEKVE